MGVRFNASTDAYSATTGLPASNVYTITCWAYITTDRNDFSGPWGTRNGSADLTCLTDSDGTTLRVWDDVNLAGGLGGTSMAVGTWYCIGVSVNGANVSFYAGTSPGVLTSASAANATTPNPPNDLHIGTTPGFPAGFLNGRIAAFKMWSSALTQAQITAELSQYVPVITTNLLRVHPFIGAGLADFSGNGNTLTAGGTTPTTESGAPIPWMSAANPTNRARLTRASCF